MSSFYFMTYVSKSSKFHTDGSVLFSEIPKFSEGISNMTIPVGREAVLTCVVEDLSNYKVSKKCESLFSISYIKPIIHYKCYKLYGFIFCNEIVFITSFMILEE